MQRASEGKDEDFNKSETELDKLIREVKNIERQEALERSQITKKASDHITTHFDMSTIRMKARNSTDNVLSETMLRNLF